MPREHLDHPNYARVGWAYPPGTYDPESGIEDGDSWTFEPDDVVCHGRAVFPNFADPEDFVELSEPG